MRFWRHGIAVAGQRLAQLDERAVERGWMQEADAAGDADARLLVDDPNLLPLQSLEIVVDAVNLKADVMQPFAALVEVAGDAGLGDDRLEQLDLAVAEREQRRA